MQRLRLPFFLSVLLGVGGACPAASAQADPAAGERVTAFWSGVTLRAGLGANSYGPARINCKNLTLPLSVGYAHTVLPATLQQPRLGLRASFALDPTEHRMTDVQYLGYTGLKPGRLSTELGVFLEGSPARHLTLYAQASAGLRLYPLLDTVGSDWRWVDNYTQLTSALGTGLSYQLSPGEVPAPMLLRAGAELHYQRYDFDTRTEGLYLRQGVGDVRFNSVQLYLALAVPFDSSVGKWGLELTGNWYGRPARDPRTKFYDVQLGLFYRILKQTPPPSKAHAGQRQGAG